MSSDVDEEEPSEPNAAEPPAERGQERDEAAEEQPGLGDVPGYERGACAPRVHGSSPASGSASVKPRGGQSPSGASQRLEQWSEAMF